MLKNVKLKKVLKGTIFKGISLINNIIPKKDNYILLYSGNKGIGFNLLPLKEYLLENKFDNNNKIICGIEELKYKDNDNCIYVNHIKAILYFLRSKHVFYTAGQIPIKPSKKQIVLHLHHGSPFKTIGNLTKINNGDEMFFSKSMATGEVFRNVFSKAYLCREENILINSEPVTDVFFKKYKKYELGDYDKILLWTPTFRQSDYLGYNDSNKEEILPTFNEDDYNELNDNLKKYNYKLIVKLHPSQDLSKYNKLKFSNLEILSNDDFKKKNMEIYNLLPQVDVLISDYSSLFLQFLLLDKPIMFVVPDIEEYGEKRGFVFENPLDFMPGAIIKTKDEFYSYLDKLHSGEDDYIDKRKKVKKIVHEFCDGKSCERLIEFSKIRKEK